MTVNLYYFKPEEYIRQDTRQGHELETINWFPLMSPRLLVLKDLVRYRWGKKIRLSPSRDALGRFLGPQNTSQHNVDVWGEVRAADILPDGIETDADAYAFYVLLCECGFTGIGVYASWASGPGFHVDVRTDRQPGDPAVWGGVLDETGRQIYVSVNQALEALA